MSTGTHHHAEALTTNTITSQNHSRCKFRFGRRVESYKNLANIERDFPIIKTDDLDLRPIHHRLADRVKAHVLICILACCLVWHGLSKTRLPSLARFFAQAPGIWPHGDWLRLRHNLIFLLGVGNSYSH
ncbi:hypothetical protein B1T45_22070 [Mycobacterium kansasii]|uniref:Transposase domain protein n=3 Tax=Mycobacterium kansasii TaxID=1768 RepID=A0A1V3XJ91_MYCKA|nr:hypothetical protein MKAN_07515 [Mycobacterium kansasii ATCC 12478]ARG57992.1 hypothetical protein B1T43_21570 [Mycobacterium kansasii]EUA01748.1 transposase domain protein [Mycobacterium kansasii 824]EUA20073.1 transposase domain protein [Mycobacterium kansasii 662]ARG63509.1 hypothetical protein B1T45_22070 [Mycobacterium kansasii]